MLSQSFLRLIFTPCALVITACTPATNAPGAAAPDAVFDITTTMPPLSQQSSASGAPNPALQSPSPQAPPTGPSLSDAQTAFREFLEANGQLQLSDVIKSAVAGGPAFTQMKTYFLNAYEGMHPSGSRTVGSQTFLCIPIREQPSLRGQTTAIDSPPSLQAAPPGALILGRPDAVCPAGEIPFKNISIADLATFQTLGDFFSKDRGFSRRATDRAYRYSLPGAGTQLSAPAPAPAAPNPYSGATLASDGYTHRYAVIWQQSRATGLSAKLNLWSPKVSGSDMSLSQTWLVVENGALTQTIESGWQVQQNWDPKSAAPFIYSTRNNYNGIGCYNLECSGFVQVTNQVVFATFADGGYSVPGGAQKFLDVGWVRKKDNGN